jgi:hypothetical protein
MSAARTTSAGRLERAGALKSRFEAASSGPQLVALVSPTCAVCLDGVEMVLQGLDDPLGSEFELHVVWTPVLSGDTSVVATKAANDRGDRRVRHYWDDTKSISTAAGIVLDLASRDRTTAWDLYLLYRRGTAWNDPLPSPASWLHQLRIDDQPSLDADSLRGAMQEASG